MKLIKDYSGSTIKIPEDTEKKVNRDHPEITEQMIVEALVDPDEVRKSNHKEGSHLYYKKKTNQRGKLRFTSVIVKEKEDGHWLESAMTTSAMKKGETIYAKESKNED